MSLEQHHPIVIKKTQMSGDRSQCGLTSLLPMSCRGRAEAFARRLHTRLRSLGGDAHEGAWLADQRPPAPPPLPPPAPHRRDSDLFFDFELECESPSSPAEEAEEKFFPKTKQSDDSDLAFYEGDVEPCVKHAAHNRPNGGAAETSYKNGGIDFMMNFKDGHSPVKTQPTSRENGNSDARLYSAICFTDCERRDSQVFDVKGLPGVDVVDCVPKQRICSRSSPSSSPEKSSAPDADPIFESSNGDIADFCADDKPNGRCNDLEKTYSNREIIQNGLKNDYISNKNESLKIFIPTIENAESASNETCKLDSNSSESTIEVCSDAKCEPISPTDYSLLHAEPEKSSGEEEIEQEEKPQRVRRCSSLKTGKTPPGTPGRKKIVRFADVLGLDLADVKTFMDEIPVIPKSAYEDLLGADLVSSSPPTYPPNGMAKRNSGKCLVPMFQQPSVVSNLADILHARQVCLESASVMEGAAITICGSVRVRNLDFHKSVHIRYTMDGWKTYTDLQASYVQGSCDGFSDKFQFLLYAPSITIGQKLEFAVRFQCKGCQYWDNNAGANYCYQCLPLGNSTGPSVQSSNDFWHPSFY